MKPGMPVFVAVVLIACLVVGNVGAYEAYYTFDVDLNNLYRYDASGEKSFYGDRYSLYNATRYQISVDVSMTGNKLGTGMIILNENGLASSSGDGFMVGDLSKVTDPAKISVLADGIQAAYEDSPYSCNITVIHDPSFSPQKTRFYHNGILVSGTSETWASNAFYLCNIVYDDFEPVTSVSIGTVHVWADGSDYMLADIIASPTSGYAPLIVNFQDRSVGFLAFDSYNLDFDDGYYSAGYWEPDIAFSHTYYEPGTYTVNYTILHDGITYYDTCEIEVLGESACTYDISMAVSKSTLIFPYTEYITTQTTLIGESSLEDGSYIAYKKKRIGGDDGYYYERYMKSAGQWYKYVDDLGSDIPFTECVEDEIYNSSVRFETAGIYTLTCVFSPQGECVKQVSRNVEVFPSSAVNLRINFRDTLTGNMISGVNSVVGIVNISNISFTSINPVSMACNFGQNISIWATAPGYKTKHIYYMIPPYVYGTTHEIPFYLDPEGIDTYSPGNTTWIIDVRNANTGDDIYGALVSITDPITHTTIDEQFTNQIGRVITTIPFREGAVGLDVSAFPYVAQSRYVNLGNATSYNTIVYLQYSGTPTPTPTMNLTITPTITSTVIPTETTIIKPYMHVDVYDGGVGYSSKISGAICRIYDGDETDITYKGSLIYNAVTTADGTTSKLQVDAGRAYVLDVSKTGYFAVNNFRFVANDEDFKVMVALEKVGAGITVATTQPTLVLPTPGGTGIQGGFIGWILDYFSEWFGVDAGTARILLALFIIMCSSVFVGGSLAGFGSGAGAGMGALIGGMFAFIAMCYVQFLPFWLLPIGIAFVGMAFFVWNRQDK